MIPTWSLAFPGADRRPLRVFDASLASATDAIDLSGKRAEGPHGFSAGAGRNRVPHGAAISGLLDEQDVVLGIPAKGKRSALARIAAWLGPKAGVSQGAALAALLRRERLGPTAIGHGVAIPHARLDTIHAPKAMLATLRQPVWFGAPDNDPVDLLLAVLWPRGDSAGFLPALARLCRLLRHAELRHRIRSAETPAEALALLGLFEERSLHAGLHPAAGRG